MYYIGLDIGGTKMNGIVYDGSVIVRELTVATPRNLKDFKKALLKLITFLAAGKKISGIGMGLAGILSQKTGQMIYSPNMKFLLRFRPKVFLAQNGYGTNVSVENDANCFALAESVLGKGRQLRSLVGITLGTGIGGGVVFDRHIYSGSRGSAGEAGHIMADFRYDAEQYFQKARDRKDYKKMGEVLGLLFANVINLLDVQAIVLGGTVASRHYRDFLPSAVRMCKKHLVNKTAPPKILVSNLKNSGSLGAALLVSGS